MSINWHGILAPLDTPSSDGRILASPLIGAVFYRPLPLPLIEREIGRVGRINRMWIKDKYIMAEGDFTTFTAVVEGDLAALTANVDRGWFTGGLDITDDVVDHRPDGMMVFTSWKVAGFHVHNSPSFGQTRLVYM